MRRVTLDEADRFLVANDGMARRFALGVSLCILSPVALIYFVSLLNENSRGILQSAAKTTSGGITVAISAKTAATWTEGITSGTIDVASTTVAANGLKANVAVGMGVTILLTIVACGVFLLIMESLKMKEYNYLEREDIELDQGIVEIVTRKRENFAPTYRKNLGIGVALCIVCVVPIMLAFAFDAEARVMLLCTDVLLVIVALGVYLIVWSMIIEGGYEKLLEEGDYTRERKNEINSNRLLARIYWCSVTFLFLGISFLTFEWWISWIIWPLAGVLYGIICGIAAVVRKRKIAG